MFCGRAPPCAGFGGVTHQRLMFGLRLGNGSSSSKSSHAQTHPLPVARGARWYFPKPPRNGVDIGGTSLVEPPPCVGTYRPTDPECDGSEADPNPCTWRDRCGGLQTYLRRTKQGIGRWLDLEGWQLRRWCDQWIEAYEIEGGIPKAERHKVARPAVNLRAAFDHLVAELPPLIDRDYARDRLALPGELYLVDKLQNARYVAYYVRARRGHDQPVVRLQIKPHVGVVDLRLPLGVSETKAALEVEAEPIKSGKFLARAVLEAEQLEGVEHKIAALANTGALRLPERVSR